MDKEKDGLGVTSARLLSSLYAGQALSITITVITFIIVTRLLGVSGYGIYTFAFGFSALVDCIGAFGIGNYFGRNLGRFFHKEDHGKVVETLLTGYSILMPITAVLTLLGVAASPYVASLFFKHFAIPSTTLTLSLMLTSSIIFFSTTESTTIQALIGFTRGKLASLVSVVVDIIQLAASVTLIKAGYGVNGAISGMLVGYILGAIMGLYLIYRLVKRQGKINIKMPSVAEMRHALSFVLPMGLINVLNFSMPSFATLFLAGFVTLSTLGSYGAALRGLTFIAIFYSTMSTAIVPLFSRAGASKKGAEEQRSYNKLLTYSLMGTLPCIVFVAVLAKPGTTLLLSSQYASTGFFLSLIALGSLIDTFQYYLASLLISKGFTTSLLKVLVVSTMLQLAAVLILVPALHASFSGNGAVIGAIIGIFFVGPITESILFVRLARKAMGFRPDFRKLGLLAASNILLILPLSISLLFAGSALLSNAVALVVGLIILALAYPAIMVLIGAIDLSDVKIISEISDKIPLLRRPMALLTGYLRLLFSMKGYS